MSVLCADEDICKLYCIAEDFDFFFAMSSKVKDGTTCSDHKSDVCIDGVCEVKKPFTYMGVQRSCGQLRSYITIFLFLPICHLIAYYLYN